MVNASYHSPQIKIFSSSNSTKGEKNFVTTNVVSFEETEYFEVNKSFKPTNTNMCVL